MTENTNISPKNNNKKIALCLIFFAKSSTSNSKTVSPWFRWTKQKQFFLESYHNAFAMVNYISSILQMYLHLPKCLQGIQLKTLDIIVM